MEYKPNDIEQKWQDEWRKNGAYRVENHSAKPKYYILNMFPYPSGSGLHVGHPLGYIASDILARYQRLRGYNVLNPMGFDAFGLPAEQYAIENGIHPAVSTADNIRRFKEQLDNIGLSFDWSREVQTCDPKYYKWTQWIFLQMFQAYYDLDADKALPISDLIQKFEREGNAGVRAATTQDAIFSAADWRAMTPKQRDETLMRYRLMFRTTGYVNWCEALGTVLANDEVVNGVSERGGFPVEIRPMLQWSMRITAYAERLLAGLDTVDFPEALKKMQRDWIGRSEGAQVFFDLENQDEKLEIYTTRPDTIFGATFMVLAPEHELVEKITSDTQRADIQQYLDWVKSRTELERKSEKMVSGAFTGAYAIHPFTGARLPVFIAEYVLRGYGTGAIMAVPADDERDLRFAEKFKMPVVPIIDKSAHPGAGIEDKVGTMINSDFLNGLQVSDAIALMGEKLEALGIGRKKIQFKLRDANYSRQRYWGEPVPIVYDADGVAHALPESELPLELPWTEDFKPGGGKGPLAKLETWVNTPQGVRDTDTMPGFAGSSWYFLRYMDPGNDSEFAAPQAVNYWQNVDFYIGGAEHAVGHLLYSRMWHKFLKDKELAPTEEPYKRLVNQGMIVGRSLYLETNLAFGEDKRENYKVAIPIQYADENDRLTSVTFDELQLKDGRIKSLVKSTLDWKTDEKGDMYLQLIPEIEKMSKSKYNVVNPDDMVAQYGADCYRMYEMFLGPVEASKPWDTKGITGVQGFLRKFWGLFFDEKTGDWAVSDEAPTRDELRVLHTAIKKVTDDVERFSMNTCVSHFMIATNELRALKCAKRAILEPLVVLIAPFAPHLAEELWHRLGHATTVCAAAWPALNAEYLKTDTINYPVQINGKLRGNVEVAAGLPADEIEKLVLAQEFVQRNLDGGAVKKFIVVPGRIVNIVA